jgi:hypothetical protein
VQKASNGRTGNFYFDPAAFDRSRVVALRNNTDPAKATYGNLGPKAFRGQARIDGDSRGVFQSDESHGFQQSIDEHYGEHVRTGVGDSGSAHYSVGGSADVLGVRSWGAGLLRGAGFFFCLVGGICGSPVPNRRWKVRPAQSANPMEIARLRLVAVCSRLPFEPVYPFR